MVFVVNKFRFWQDYWPENRRQRDKKKDTEIVRQRKNCFLSNQDGYDNKNTIDILTVLLLFFWCEFSLMRILEKKVFKTLQKTINPEERVEAGQI